MRGGQKNGAWRCLGSLHLAGPHATLGLIPSIHWNYYPTGDLHSGDSVTFKVRTFNKTAGKELWDFGDGSPAVEVKSDGNAVKLAADGHAVTKHAYKKPGDECCVTANSSGGSFDAETGSGTKNAKHPSGHLVFGS